jgi:hypothetical protein
VALLISRYPDHIVASHPEFEHGLRKSEYAFDWEISKEYVDHVVSLRESPEYLFSRSDYPTFG